MKKSKFVTLLLISSALASCEATKEGLAQSCIPTYTDYGQETCDSLKDKVQDSSDFGSDSIPEKRRFDFDVQIPSFYQPSDSWMGHVIRRNGFGTHGSHMSFSG